MLLRYLRERTNPKLVCTSLKTIDTIYYTFDIGFKWGQVPKSGKYIEIKQQ